MRDDSNGKVGIGLPAFLVAAFAGRFAALKPHRRLLHFNKVALHGNYSATASTKALVTVRSAFCLGLKGQRAVPYKWSH
jgi:hypothetical protein